MAKRCLEHYKKRGPEYNYKQVISPIIQGGIDDQLRKISANQLLDLDAKMYAIGGLAVGEPKEEMLKTVNFLDQIMPKEKPRYLFLIHFAIGALSLLVFLTLYADLYQTLQNSLPNHQTILLLFFLSLSQYLSQNELLHHLN